MNHLDRILLEKSIIGELLSDNNAFIKVGDILSPVNFSNLKYRQIYIACEKLYPNNIIELWSVSKETGIPANDLMIEFTENISKVLNLPYAAFLLLEINIKDQYIELIHSIVLETESALKRQDLMEIETFAKNTPGEIFKTIETALSYLKSNKMYESEALKVEGFYFDITKKIERIKSANRVKALFHNLENLYEYSYKKKEVLKAITNITKFVIGNEISSDLENKIITLSFSL